MTSARDHGKEKNGGPFFLSRLPLRTNFRRERDVWYEAEREPVKGPTPGYANKESRDNRDRAEENKRHETKISYTGSYRCKPIF